MTILHGAPPDTLRQLLNDEAEHDHPSPARLLADLPLELALAKPANAVHSIAEMVAHINANMRFNLALAEGREQARENWPNVSPQDWPRLAGECLDLLARLQELTFDEANLSRVVYEATGEEPAWTVGYKLTASVAKHGA